MRFIKLSAFIFINMEYYNNLDLNDIVYFCEIENLWKTEKWKDIDNYIGFYQVSDLGRIKSLKRFRVHLKRGKEIINERILKQTKGSSNYLTVTLWKGRKKKTHSVHLTVANMFLGYKHNSINQFVCDHKNNTLRQCNAVFNLQIIPHRINSTKDSVNKTGFLGVYKDKNKFRSMINYNNKRYSLGTFSTPQEAHNIYNEVAGLILLNKEFNHLVKHKKTSRN